MTIRNKYLVPVIVWLFRLELKKVHFTYRKELYDEDITTLAFLNQVKHEFTDQAEQFKEEIDLKIEEVIKTEV